MKIVALYISFFQEKDYSKRIYKYENAFLDNMLGEHVVMER